MGTAGKESSAPAALLTANNPGLAGFGLAATLSGLQALSVDNR